MRRRQGFTLVELLVAMALIIFMMYILSEAFGKGLESFRTMKAVGDMSARMRSANTILRRDLTADHFEGRRRLSTFDSTVFAQQGPPREGFFRIWQGTQAVVESTDAGGNSLKSTRATDHILHFTVKLRGNDRQDFFTANVPGDSPLLTHGRTDSRYQDSANTYSSQWAEVAYFLRPNGNLAGSTPLYALYRRQLLLVPDNQDINWGSKRVPARRWNEYLDVSCKPNPQDPNFLYFNSPIDITVPQRRFGMESGASANGGLPIVRPTSDMRTWTYPRLGIDNPPLAGGNLLNSALEGGDLLLPDVISFEVAVATSTSVTDFVPLVVSTTNKLYDDATTTTPITILPITIQPILIDAAVRATAENSLVGVITPPTNTRGTPRAYDTWSNVVDGAYDYSKWNRSTTAVITHELDLIAHLTGAVADTAPVATTTAGKDPVHIPSQGTIHAVRITLRVWDAKTQQARQITIIQDM